MKRIILYLTVIVLLFAACDRACKINYPKYVNPIDWENYNDIHTVYWNTIHCCDETISLQSDTIMISGWKPWSYREFSLCDDAKYADRGLGLTAASPIISIWSKLPEFETILDTCDLTKKCFVKGNLSFQYGSHRQKYCRLECCIEITNINDIYFE